MEEPKSDYSIVKIEAHDSVISTQDKLTTEIIENNTVIDISLSDNCMENTDEHDYQSVVSSEGEFNEEIMKNDTVIEISKEDNSIVKTVEYSNSTQDELTTEIIQNNTVIDISLSDNCMENTDEHDYQSVVSSEGEFNKEIIKNDTVIEISKEDNSIVKTVEYSNSRQDELTKEIMENDTIISMSKLDHSIVKTVEYSNSRQDELTKEIMENDTIISMSKLDHSIVKTVEYSNSTQDELTKEIMENDTIISMSKLDHSIVKTVEYSNSTPDELTKEIMENDTIISISKLDHSIVKTVEYSNSTQDELTKEIMENDTIIEVSKPDHSIVKTEEYNSVISTQDESTKVNDEAIGISKYDDPIGKIEEHNSVISNQDESNCNKETDTVVNSLNSNHSTILTEEQVSAECEHNTVILTQNDSTKEIIEISKSDYSIDWAEKHDSVIPAQDVLTKEIIKTTSDDSMAKTKQVSVDPTEGESTTEIFNTTGYFECENAEFTSTEYVINDTSTEEAVVNDLFYTCDVNKTGLVAVSCLIKYLQSNILHHHLQPESALSSLTDLLDPDGLDVFVDIVTYRKAMMKWIGDIRRESGENNLSEDYSDIQQNAAESKSLCFQETLLSVYSSSNNTCGVIETSTFSECDVADLSNKLENLQYQYKKQGEDNAQLQQQIESQEETITSLSQENLTVSKKIKSLQEMSVLRSEIQAENEELKSVLTKYQETKRKLENRLNQMEKENTVLVENIDDCKLKIQHLLADLDGSRYQIKDLETTLMEQKQLLEKVQDIKSFQEVQLTEKEMQNKDLEISVHELRRMNEDLKKEYGDLQLQLVHTQQELKNLENMGQKDLSIPPVCDEDILDDDNPMSSTMSSPSSCDIGVKRSSSIHNELKAMLDDSLPSPLCERKQSIEGITLENSSSENSLTEDIWFDVNLDLTQEDDTVTDPIKLDEKCKGEYRELLNEICDVICKPESNIDVHKSKSWPSVEGENDVEETSNLQSRNCLRKLIPVLSQLKAENIRLRTIHDKSVESLVNWEKDLTVDKRFLVLQDTLTEERTQKLSLQQELESVKSKFDEIFDELQHKVKELVELHEEKEKLQENITTLTRTNMDLSERCHQAELASTNLQETLEREKKTCSELEGNLSNTKLARQLDLLDIWRLVHKDVELEYMDDQNDSPISSSTDLLKDQISKEIETLKGRLVKRQAALGVLKGKQMALNLRSMRTQYNSTDHSPSSPLVDALTIDFFDGKYPMSRKCKKVCSYSGLTHHSFEMDKSTCDDSRLPAYHALSCPSLHQHRRQFSLDGNQNNVSYTNLNTSSSSSTSGIDTSPRYHRSADGQNKRRDFIRSSIKRGNSSTTTSNSAESNTNSDCSYRRQQHASNVKKENPKLSARSPSGIRRFSFNAAIENRKDMSENIQPIPRNRSSSYQAAIEQGQKDSIEDVGYASSTTDTTPEDHQEFSFGHIGAVKNDVKSVSFHLQEQNVYEYNGDKCTLNVYGGDTLNSGEDNYQSYEGFDVHHSSQNGRQLLNPARKLSTLIEEDIDHFDGHGENGMVSPKKTDQILKYSPRFDYDKVTDSAEIYSREKGSGEGIANITSKEMPGKSAKADLSHVETTGQGMHERTAANLAGASQLGPCHMDETHRTLVCNQTQLKCSPVGQSAVCTYPDLNALSPEGKADPVSKSSTIPSRLAKLRETNLAKKREHMRSMKLPDLQEQMDGSNASTLNPEIDVIPPEASSDPVTPSIPDSFLEKLGLKQSLKLSKCDDLTEQEIECKFLSLSLAFKTDKLTLEQRKDIQERSRDIAERNVDQELQGLRNVVEKLIEVIDDAHVHELVTKIQNHIDVLEQTAARVSSRAEVFGAVQQEMRMSRAMDVMVLHVQNVKRSHEKDRSELDEARKLLMEKPFGSHSLADLDSKRSMSVISLNVPQKLSFQRSRSPSPMPRDKTRRRSEIALPRILGGHGCPTLRHSASLDSSLFMECPPKLGAFNHMVELEEDPKQKFQAAVASTSVQNVITTTLRKASLERQNAIPSQPSLSRESSTLSRENSSEKMKDQSSNSSAAPSKQGSQEEEAYQKGFEDGVKAKLGKELSDLREQQNSVGNNLEEIMEKVENSEEEELLKENEKAMTNGIIQLQNIAFKMSWEKPTETLRFFLACIIFMIAICVVFMTLFPGTASGMEIQIDRHNYGMPPL